MKAEYRKKREFYQIFFRLFYRNPLTIVFGKSMIIISQTVLYLRLGTGEIMQDYSDLQQMDDESLCKIASQNRDAEGILVSRYLGMVHRLAYQHRGILDFEDLVQEGCIGLLNAIGGFDSARDVQFKPYAYVCIRNRIYRALKRAGETLSPVVPLEDDLMEGGADPEQLFLGKERLNLVMKKMDDLLSPLERKVFFAHLAGFDYQTISCTLHISQKSIDNALQRVRKKLKTIDSV